jgi:hypothetical protein
MTVALLTVESENDAQRASAIMPQLVMAGLVPAIHVFDAAPKTWMPGKGPGMTSLWWW